MKLVVDCANGAAYHIAPNVFRELGAEVIEIGVEPNGLNINLDCGATHPEVLQRHVLEHKADLGVALDGDGDRVVLVDQLGNILDGDELLYIIAKHRQETGVLKGGVVGTVMSNFGLEYAFQKLNIEFVRVPVGDRHIMTELANRKWHLGGEPSGHIICTDAIVTGDGIISALQVLSVMKHTHKSLAELKSGLNKFPQALVNINVTEDSEPHSKPRIQDAVKNAETELGKTGRVLLRRSGTEKLVRVMVEGENEVQVFNLANQLAAIVKEELVKEPSNQPLLG